MPTVRVNGAELFYQVHGQGAAILGVHGSPSSALLWQDPAGELSRLGRCIIYDRRGYLRSLRPEPFDTVDLDDHVGDAAALIDMLAAAPAVVIGRSTGGLIALELARRHPDLVRALVLLEPAVFTVDRVAAAWAQHLREQVLRAAASDPSAASQALFRAALGERSWESLPGELREIFTADSPALLAEIRGRGLDLSTEPVRLTDADLATIDQPTLILAAVDSAAVFRRVCDRLTEVLPHTERVTVPGDHLINPAHPAILEFVGRVFTR